MSYTLGVDIGGTNIAAVIINEEGEIFSRAELPSNPSDKDSMFEQVVTCIETTLSETSIQLSQIEGIGIGVPGKIDREQGIAVYQNNLPWKSFPIVEKLKQHFAMEHIYLDNDVYMATLAEWNHANLNKEDTFVYMTISTGISCSIIHNGSFVRGAGFAGELGLYPVISRLSPNRIQELEKAAAGPAIGQLAQTYFPNKDITAADLFQAYEENHEVAVPLIKEVVASLAHGIYSIVCLIDPHRLVIGGGVMNHNPFLLDLIKHELKNYLIPDQYSVLDRMFVSHHKHNSGVIGAGLMGFQMNQRKITGQV